MFTNIFLKSRFYKIKIRSLLDYLPQQVSWLILYSVSTLRLSAVRFHIYRTFPYLPYAQMNI